MMRVSIGNDHAGTDLKNHLVRYLKSLEYEVTNQGTNDHESMDYPDPAHAVSEDVASGKCDFGILICGSANGVAMTANKHAEVRAGLAWNKEVAALIKQHNNANVICIPARFVSKDEGLEILKEYMNEEFEGGRHERRINKIACMVVGFVFACFSGINAQLLDASSYANSITPEDLRTHLEVLASDEFEGRETGKPGAEKAAEYIANHFKSIGIQPYSDDSYYQPVELIRSQIEGGSASAGTVDLEFLEDFIFYPGLKVDKMNEIEMIVIHDVNQLDGADVKNKMVVVKAHEEDGETMWRVGLNDLRMKASTSGAAGIILVGKDLSMIRSRMRPWLSRESLTLNREDPEVTEGTRIPTFLIQASSVEEWWVNTPMKSWKKWEKSLQKGRVYDPIELQGIRWNFTLDGTSDLVIANNVLGYIPGSDPILKEELLVVTAHYDHVGIIDGEIHNGADDDGSGTVTVLELSEAFMKAVGEGNGPRRSVLLMTVVGEEKGLLGSEWYADHPVWPLEQTIANLNIDMIGRVDEAHAENDRYVYLIGSDKLSSELHEISEAANNNHTGLALDYTFNAPDDPNRFYYRSDHYNFAKNNIPVIFYFSGVHEDYHQPGDDPEKIHYPKTAEIGKLVFHTAWQLLNQDERIVVDRINDFPEK